MKRMSRRSRSRSGAIGAGADGSLDAAARQIAACILMRDASPRHLATLLDDDDGRLLTELSLHDGSPLPDSDDGSSKEYRAFANALLRRLRPLAQAAEVRVEPFDRNLDHMVELLALSRPERDLLRLGSLLRLHLPLRDLFDSSRYKRSHNSDWQRQRQVAYLLNVDNQRLAALFAKQSRLVQLGLLDANDLNVYVCEHFANALAQPDADPAALLHHKLRRADAGTLALADFDHLPDLPRVLRHLQRALERGTVGVNLLIYGPPGTGKTELVRMLANHLQASLWEVPVADDDGDLQDGRCRIGAFALAQRLLHGNERHLLLFDEIEDVFGRSGGMFDLFGGRRQRINAKGWINEQLERNPVPTFWLSNDIAAIDPAHIRRFDEVIQLRAPSRSVRQRIIDRHLPGPMVSEPCRQRIAAIDALPPAQVQRVGRVLAAMEDVSTAERDQAALRLLENSLRAMGMAERLPNPELPAYYDPGVLNADADLDQLADLLGDGHGARLLLHGPPGTGKTAFAHYLGQRLERPVRVRRLSDLLDMYVGGTERNIADAFRDAADEGAILLIDEADSLLREREGARQSWEVTQVNEMLTQMEHFEGLFIASTNLVAHIDAASLRRFDFKLRFDYLRREQRLAMFQRLWRDLSAGKTHDGSEIAIDAQAIARIAALDRLTPGDFATVRRQLGRSRQPVGINTVVERLAAEVAIKPGACRRAIGFHPD